MFCDFETRTFGKWILAGEHAVVRGHQALVFPIKSRQLHLQFKTLENLLSAEYSGETAADTQLLFWSVLEHGLQLVSRSLKELSGHFVIQSNIPVGAGMGASAALCVAMSRWFAAQGMIPEGDSQLFARELEHLFHGKSSGLDIAGVSSEQGAYFKQGHCSPLTPVLTPQWYLSSCHQIGITSHCIQQVQAIWDKDPAFAEKIDIEMVESVEEAKMALETGGPEAIPKLAAAVNKAAQCFFQWGLVTESLQQHMSKLLDAGAIAVKPTGSGGGGYVLSLWENQPNPNLALLQV